MTQEKFRINWESGQALLYDESTKAYVPFRKFVTSRFESGDDLLDWLESEYQELQYQWAEDCPKEND